MIAFDFETDHILENERVRLQPLGSSDFEHLLPYSTNEPALWKYNVNGAAGEENLRKYLSLAEANRKAGKEYPFVVFDKKLGRYAGSTRYYDIKPERKILDIGYTWYGKDFQGTGLNAHCKYLLFDFAFERFDAERVGLAANNRNERSIRAMKGVGCTVEGVMRNHGYDGEGNRMDVILLSVLRDEWYNGVKQMLQRKLL